VPYLTLDPFPRSCKRREAKANLNRDTAQQAGPVEISLTCCYNSLPCTSCFYPSLSALDPSISTRIARLRTSRTDRCDESHFASPCAYEKVKNFFLPCSRPIGTPCQLVCAKGLDGNLLECDFGSSYCSIGLLLWREGDHSGTCEHCFKSARA
jgi:hypothetical protein